MREAGWEPKRFHNVQCLPLCLAYLHLFLVSSALWLRTCGDTGKQVREMTCLVMAAAPYSLIGCKLTWPAVDPSDGVCLCQGVQGCQILPISFMSFSYPDAQRVRKTVIAAEQLCFLSATCLTAHKQAEGRTYAVSSSEAQEPFLLAEYVCVVHLITDVLIVTSSFDNPGCVDEVPENIYSAQCFREDVIYVKYEMLRSSQPHMWPKANEDKRQTLPFSLT